MKFAEHLSAHITPEWRKQYINYEEMKLMLYSAIEQAPSADIVEPEVLSRYFAKFDEQFFHYCDKELKKINTFYSEKLAEATRKYANLHNELCEALDQHYHGKERKRHQSILRKKSIPARKIQELKLAFSEFYLSLILLQNYQNLNFTGFRKILKKHDKLLGLENGARWRQEYVENSHFYINKDIDRLIHETETTVTQDLEGGDRQRAMKRLRVPPLGEQQSPWITFKVGLFSGSLIVLAISVIISAVNHQTRDDWRVVCRLYRGPLLIVEFMFLWGINVYGWRSSGVNHVLIFELDPRNHLSEQHIIEMASIFGVIWSLSILAFLYTPPHMPAYIQPLILYLIMFAFLFNPTKTLRYQARFWTLRVLFRVLVAPFYYVGFADFWIADQLNSLVPAFLDLQYFICFYITNNNLYIATDPQYCIDKLYTLRPIVACLPAWFRLAQCLRRYRDTREKFPHLANAFKYATSFFVVIFSTLNLSYNGQFLSTTDNPYFLLWLVASILSSLYSYIWDIKLDFGLFDSNAGDNKFLREEIVYPSTFFYYFGIVEDLILRFGWVISISLNEFTFINSDIVVSVLAPLEVFRRFVWNFFRLENEHLNNCGKFRAVRDISVAPIDCSDHINILRMMDEEDGVINRRKKKSGVKKKESKENNHNHTNNHRARPKVLFDAESTDELDI